MQAQLNLGDYYLDEFSFDANREHVPSQTRCGTLDLDFDINRNADNPLDFMISMTVDINSLKEDFEKCDYCIHLKLTGFFSFADGTSEDTISRMIAPSGLAMLYGVARGVVADATAISWHGKFVLPSMNLIEVIRRKSESAGKAKKPARRVKKI